MNFEKNVQVYVENSLAPVFEGTKMEMSKSPVLVDLMTSINVCDLCPEPITLIFADEEQQTVVSTLSQLSITPEVEIFTNNRGMYKLHRVHKQAKRLKSRKRLDSQ